MEGADSTLMLAAGAAVGAAMVGYVVRRLSGSTSGPKHPVALNAAEFTPFELSAKTVVSPDTRIFRFKLQSKDHVLGLPVGQHMYLKASIDGKEVQRAYTPISSNDDVGYFDLMIKVYFSGVHPKFPEGGKLSQYLEAMQIGEKIAVRGPSGRFEYLGNGKYLTKSGQEWVPKTAKKIGMIAGGTGITPMLQILRHVLKNPKDTTQVYLLFANQTEQDILLRPELEECAKDPRVKLWYTLDRPEPTWKYSTGFIDLDMVTARMPPPEGGPAESIVLMCGPPPMITYACKPNLEKRGFTPEQLFVF